MTKGLILAGGSGTRLHPITKVINKHLIPIGNKPMIQYPVVTLVNSQVTEIMVVSNPNSIGPIAKLLGSGSSFGCNFYFRAQESPRGISDGINLAREFVDKDNLMVILGDNLVKGTFSTTIKDFEKSKSGCGVFLKENENFQGFGVALMQNGKIIEVIEKPTSMISKMIVTGIYLFDYHCFDMIEDLYPSSRNELEVTDLINKYISLNSCDTQIIEDDWLDAGTFSALEKAGKLFGSE